MRTFGGAGGGRVGHGGTFLLASSPSPSFAAAGVACSAFGFDFFFFFFFSVGAGAGWTAALPPAAPAARFFFDLFLVEEPFWPGRI